MIASFFDFSSGVKKIVFDKFQVELEPEVKMVGEF